MKRILIFSLAYYPQVGGAEVALKELTDRLGDFEFDMLTLRFGQEPREEQVGRVRVYRVGNGVSYLQKMLFAPRAALFAARLHRQNPYDAWWAMMSYMLFPIVLLRFAGIRTPYLLTLQEGDPWEHMFRRWFILPFRWMLSYGFRHAAAVQVISTYLAKWATRMGYRGDVAVVPNGVDTAHFSLQARAPREGTVLITASRLVHKNAVDIIIRALVALPDTVSLTIAGTGPEEQNLRDLAHSLGVEKRVSFLGFVAHAELPRHLSCADLFVRPSRSEGMGNSFIEAMAAGLPVIGTREGGIADFLTDGETGWVVEKDSPEQIARAIEDIVVNPDKVKRVTEAARRMVEEKYEWDGIATRMGVLLENVCAR